MNVVLVFPAGFSNPNAEGVVPEGFPNADCVCAVESDGAEEGWPKTEGVSPDCALNEKGDLVWPGVDG